MGPLEIFKSMFDKPEYQPARNLSSISPSPAQNVLKLLNKLNDHSATIGGVSWSPDGKTLASASDDFTVRLWNIDLGKEVLCFKGHASPVSTVAWSPQGDILASGGATGLSNLATILVWDKTGTLLSRFVAHRSKIYSVAWSSDGNLLASASADQTVCIWDIATGNLLKRLSGHSEAVNSVAWFPDNRVVSASSDRTIKIWDPFSGKTLKTFSGHAGSVLDLAWLKDGQILASCSSDATIRLWDINSERQIRVLEGHTSAITSISFSDKKLFLASKSIDHTVRLWQCDIWHTVTVLPEQSYHYSHISSNIPRVAFCPTRTVLSTLGEVDTVIRNWSIDELLLPNESANISPQYTNAKIVLVGDSGVGKSGLGLLLSGHKFTPTESTHGRHVWMFNSQKVKMENGREEMREILLWDLAGQPGYRIIHQLHLIEVAIALVVFDARSETDPFAGVRYWNRALMQSWRLQGNTTLPLKKFLVAARIDRGSIGVSQERIKSLMQELSFTAYFETSAKEGWQIEDLSTAIVESIDWEMFPRVNSDALFHFIKEFLIKEKESRRLLSSADDLYRIFLSTRDAPLETENLRSQFDTCIARVESRGLIKRLSFSDLVLLQPELLDAYASALVNIAKDEPDGMGSILEEDARLGRFRLSEDERLKDKNQEKLLLIATIEDLLRFEIALRENADDGAYLIFPSQFTRENPDLPDPAGKSVVFSFEGAVLNVYATLAVRLSHSGQFKKKEMWKNAAAYTAGIGGVCGMFLRETGEGRGELTLFFDPNASETIRFQFEEYVKSHLERRALPSSVTRRRIFVCPECNTPVSDLAVTKRRERDFEWIACNVCEKKISLLDREERLEDTIDHRITEMDRVADAQREIEIAKSTLEGKIATGDFDVFLCHNAADKPTVKRIGEMLKIQGILPWLDEWELRPGVPWQKVLEEQINKIKTVAVFVGDDGIGPWQRREIEAFLIEFVERECLVIPVLLPDTSNKPDLPIFLKNFTWVDFRKRAPDPLLQLLWGVTGQKTFGRDIAGDPSVEGAQDVVRELREVKADVAVQEIHARTYILEPEVQDLLKSVHTVLGEIKQRNLTLPDASLDKEIKQVATLIEDTKADVGHKVKVTLPLIPGILSYETEMQLKGGLNLQNAWRKLMIRIRKDQ